MPAINISNGTIMEISRDRGTFFVTVTYKNSSENRKDEQTVQLVVTARTIVLDENGGLLPASSLKEGMRINASFSSAMTRSIPPQASAYIVQITRNRPQENVTIGRILEISPQTNSFTTIRDLNPSSVIRFNVSENTRIFDRMGRPVSFSRLFPGLRVRVRHAAFMTASIPPQTTAIEVQLL